MLNYSELKYTSLFCEENIWHLGQSLISIPNFSQINIIIISNTNKQVAIYQQKSVPENQAVIWDYHVILEATYQEGIYIFDFDSRLEFPCLKEFYYQHSFPEHIPKTYQSQFRKISAIFYLERFSSDRSHMKGIIPIEQYPPDSTIISSHMEPVKLTDLINFNLKIKSTVLTYDF